MKNDFLKQFKWIIGLALITCFTGVSPILSLAGPGAGGGATYVKNLEATLDYLIINGEIKNSMLNYLKTLKIDQIDTSTSNSQIVKAAFQRMLKDNQLEKDIQTPKNYYLGNNCLDAYNKKVSASTLIGVPGAKVCFDKAKLLIDLQRLSLEEVMIRLASIAFHEHVHHFQVRSSNPAEIKRNETEAYHVSAYVLITAKTVQMPVLKWTPPEPNNEAGGLWSDLPNDFISKQRENEKLVKWGCDYFSNCYSLPTPLDIESLILNFEKKKDLMKKQYYETINAGIYSPEFPEYSEIANEFEMIYGKNNRLSQLYRSFILPKCDKDLVSKIISDAFSKGDIPSGENQKLWKQSLIEDIFADNSSLTTYLQKLKESLIENYKNHTPERQAYLYNVQIQSGGYLGIQLRAMKLIREAFLNIKHWNAEDFFSQRNHGQSIDLYKCLETHHLAYSLDIDKSCYKNKRDMLRKFLFPLSYKIDISRSRKGYVVRRHDFDLFDSVFPGNDFRTSQDLSLLDHKEIVEKTLMGGPGNRSLRITCTNAEYETAENSLREKNIEPEYKYDPINHEITIYRKSSYFYFNFGKLSELLGYPNLIRQLGDK